MHEIGEPVIWRRADEADKRLVVRIEKQEKARRATVAAKNVLLGRKNS